MDEAIEYRVTVKASAVTANDAVDAEAGTVLAFASRRAAEAEAARLTEAGGAPLAVQAAAPQDPDDVDAYLVAAPDRRTHEPVATADGRLGFETTGRQYGALGEALLLSHRTDPPPLLAHVRSEFEDAGVEPGHVGVDLDPDPDPVVVGGPGPDERRRWIPDCVAVARDRRTGEPLERYHCEVKTGAASFQRDQAAVMAHQATRGPVLALRFDVTGLPDRYTVRITAVEPAPLPEGASFRPPGGARLDDFG